MNREEKAQAVASLSGSVGSARNAFLIDFKGITVPQVTELRKQIRETDSKYLVVKNSLTLIAIENSVMTELRDQFQGPTAVAYNDDDPVALAKVLTKFAKDVPAVKFKGALLDGKVVPTNDIISIASLPSREELLTKLVFMLQSPIQGIVNVLNANIRNLAVVLDQVAKQKSGAAAEE